MSAKKKVRKTRKKPLLDDISHTRKKLLELIGLLQEESDYISRLARGFKNVVEPYKWVDEKPLITCERHQVAYYNTFFALKDYPNTLPCCILAATPGVVEGVKKDNIYE